MNRDSFTCTGSVWMACFPPCLIAMAEVTNITLNRAMGVDVFYLFLTLRESTFLSCWLWCQPWMLHVWSLSDWGSSLFPCWLSSFFLLSFLVWFHCDQGAYTDVYSSKSLRCALRSRCRDMIYAGEYFIWFWEDVCILLFLDEVPVDINYPLDWWHCCVQPGPPWHLLDGAVRFW